MKGQKIPMGKSGIKELRRQIKIGEISIREAAGRLVDLGYEFHFSSRPLPKKRKRRKAARK